MVVRIDAPLVYAFESKKIRKNYLKNQIKIKIKNIRGPSEPGRMLRDAIIDHLRVFPEAVVVIEEYDKMVG